MHTTVRVSKCSVNMKQSEKRDAQWNTYFLKIKLASIKRLLERERG